MKNNRSKLISFLKKARASKSNHSGRTLADHLIGTYDILKSWGCDEEICIAGGLHSIYGTNVYVFESLMTEERELVQGYFGIRAETLAWLFGSINRPKGIESGLTINRRTKKKFKIEPSDLRSLRLIEAANLLEQKESLGKWPIIMNEMKKQIDKYNASD